MNDNLYYFDSESYYKSFQNDYYQFLVFHPLLYYINRQNFTNKKKNGTLDILNRIRIQTKLISTAMESIFIKKWLLRNQWS